MSKPTFQKIYEKLTMVEQNPQKLVLIGVRHDGGKPAVVLAIREGETITPVAEMLNQVQCDSMSPDWKYTEALIALVDGAKEIEDRVGVQSFEGQYPKIDEYFENAKF